MVERDRRVLALNAELATRDRLAGELELALAERDRRAAEFQALLDELGERVKTAQAELDAVNGRIADLDGALTQTLERQQAFDADLEETRRGVIRAGEILAEREAELIRLRAEIARRGPPGTPVAVRVALTELFQVAGERRRQRLAATQPWRLPPQRRG